MTGKRKGVMDKVLRIFAAALLVLGPLAVRAAGQTMQQAIVKSPQPPNGVPTITVTSSVCVNSDPSQSVTCTWPSSGAVGDLAVFISKSATAAGTWTPTWTFTGTAPCTPTQVVAPTVQPNGGGTFVKTIYACIITTAVAAAPNILWTVSSSVFTDIETFTVHTSNTWKTAFVDQVSTPIVATVTSTSCPTGTTAATTNANDFILATCDVFNAGQTWGTLALYTQYPAASRNTAGVYYAIATSTGAKSAIVPLSVSDFGVGMLVAFASN